MCACRDKRVPDRVQTARLPLGVVVGLLTLACHLQVCKRAILRVCSGVLRPWIPLLYGTPAHASYRGTYLACLLMGVHLAWFCHQQASHQL